MSQRQVLLPLAVRLLSVLEWHFGRYPLLQAADIYKLVHQGVFGPGHIIADVDQARRALEEELAGLRRRRCLLAVESEEPLDPDGRLVRLNLEPLESLPDAVDRVLPVLLATAAETRGGPELMAARVAEALDWCRDRLPDRFEALARLASESEEVGWPARHHSSVYAAAYRPVYRVVSARRWRQAHRPCGTSG